MAWAYRVERMYDDDVVEPTAWVRNMNRLAGEFNGYLDRDNIPASAINEARLVNNACHGLFGDTVATPWDSQAGLVGWHGDDTNGVELLAVERLWAFDSLLETEASVAYRWSLPTGTSLAETQKLRAEGRVVVDGTVVGETGGISAFHRRGGFYVCGATPIAAGWHKVRFEVRAYMHLGFPSPAAPGSGLLSLSDDDAKVGTTPAAASFRIQDGELVVLQKKR